MLDGSVPGSVAILATRRSRPFHGAEAVREREWRLLGDRRHAIDPPASRAYGHTTARGVMVVKLPRRPPKSPAPKTGYVGDHADKLRHGRSLTHDEDERPSREDRDYGSTIFTRPQVPLPRFLTGKKRHPR
jgi:hypothetical protein